MTRFALLAALSVASSAPAAGITVDTAPAQGLPGFLTHTISLTTSTREELSSIDAVIEGPLFQSYGIAEKTVFASDLECFVCLFPESHYADSHFLFDRDQVLTIERLETDTATKLAAVFAPLSTSPLVRVSPIAQVTTDGSMPIDYRFEVVLGPGQDPFTFSGTIVPEPGSAVLAIATLGPLLLNTRNYRRRNGSAGAPR